MDRVEFVRRQLQQARDSFTEGPFSIDKLESIASVRFVLNETAEWIYSLEVRSDPAWLQNKTAQYSLKHLIVEVQQLCDETPFDWPRSCQYSCFIACVIQQMNGWS